MTLQLRPTDTIKIVDAKNVSDANKNRKKVTVSDHNRRQPSEAADVITTGNHILFAQYLKLVI